jgi:hypothetical protein
MVFVMVCLLAAAWCDIVLNIVSALARALGSVFHDDVNDRFLLGDIVKHWLTILIEGTHIDQKTVGRF